MKPTTSPTSGKLSGILCYAIILLGALWRIFGFVRMRSLWLDECMLGVNLAQRDYAGLLQPLDYTQGAPIGFILFNKVLVNLFGFHEWTLRATSLLAGLLLLVLFVRFVFKLLPLYVAVAVGLLMAFSNSFVYYSNEFKPYIIDALLGFLLLQCSYECVLQGFNRRRLGCIGLLCVLGSWFSWTMLFMAAGVLPYLLFYKLADNRKQNPAARFPYLDGQSLMIAGLGVLSLLSFFAQHKLFLSHLSSQRHLFDYWHKMSAFGPGFKLILDPLWIWRSLGNVCWHGETLGMWSQQSCDFVAAALKSPSLPTYYLSPLLLLLSLWCFFRKNPRLFLLCMLPLVVTMLAGNFEKYPFGQRLILFLVPQLLISFGYLIESCVQLTRKLADKLANTKSAQLLRAASLALIYGLFINIFAPSWSLAFYQVVYPNGIEEIRPLLTSMFTYNAKQGIRPSYWGSFWAKTLLDCQMAAQPDLSGKLSGMLFADKVPGDEPELVARQVHAAALKMSVASAASGQPCWLVIGHQLDETIDLVNRRLANSPQLRIHQQYRERGCSAWLVSSQ